MVECSLSCPLPRIHGYELESFMDRIPIPKAICIYPGGTYGCAKNERGSAGAQELLSMGVVVGREGMEYIQLLGDYQSVGSEHHDQ